jgi:hypothetical protein
VGGEGGLTARSYEFKRRLYPLNNVSPVVVLPHNCSDKKVLSVRNHCQRVHTTFYLETIAAELDTNGCLNA